MKRIILLLLAFTCITLAMQPEDVRRNVDANGYRYRDENTIQDKRKIAILSYGSLVNQPANLTTGARLQASTFAPTDIQLPVSLMRESSSNTPQRRITAVVDRDGDLKRVWAARSRFKFMPNARNNLAAREGARLQSQDAGYDLANIFYMKKLVPGRMRDSNEEVVPGVDGWVIRTAANNRQQLPVEVQNNVARWANANGYSAVIWASFPPNISNQQEVIRRLAEDDTLLRNTQEYVRNLPDGAQSALERVILVGKDALRTLVERRAAREQQAGASQPAIAREQAQAAPAAPADRERHYENFTYFQRGDLPILISAPHGGTKRTGVPARVGGINPLTGREVNLFVTVWDDGTLELAQRVSDDIFGLLGKRPYFVAADFTRKEVDANRPAADAFENAAAAPIYNRYHNTLRDYVAEIRNRFGTNAILVDIHGQGVDADTVYRGTSNKRNVNRLLQRSGEAALTGENSILGVLGNKGYKIFPRNNEERTPEKSIFAGGYIVRNYGSNNANGIDALQLENGWDLRRGNGQVTFARDLAEAIAQFYRTYLAR
jgi:N-formylglutamate amidohydrolase